jgi:hypothetical protein
MFVFLILCSLLHSNAFAQQMDAKLNLAIRSLDTIEGSLSNIRQGDVAQYNKLSDQLTKAADLLKATESKTHPDYVKSVQRWSSLRQTMVSTATQWQQAQSTANIVPKTSNQNSSAQSYNSTESKPVAENTINPDAILSKYQKQNRPKLGNYPNPSEVEAWATQMKMLQTSELQKDLALLAQSKASSNDIARVSRWIQGDFQTQLQQDVRTRLNSFNSQVDSAVQLANQIRSIKPDDKMRAYNFAKDANGRRNMQMLESGLIATANASALEQVFPSFTDPKRQEKLAAIAIAQQTLDTFIANTEIVNEELAKLPQKTKKTSKVSFKGISQELWLNGSVLASLDKKGSIWMNSTDVGDITANGTIWVRGNDLGSIEPDGKVWFRGNHIGTLEHNGSIWRSGSQVGLIEDDGKVWINGNANGSIVPFEGEWKRAAVIFYFRDIFAE